MRAVAYTHCRPITADDALSDIALPIDARDLKEKSASLHWEAMFTRALYDIPDIVEQSNLLNTVAQLVDQGRLRTTMTEHFGRITPANLTRAHALIESGRARGKVVLEGF